MSPPSQPHATGDVTGPIVGTDPGTNTTIQLDRFNTDRNGPHSFVFGKPNTGKSHDAKIAIYRALTQYTDLEVIILDAGDEYAAITETQYTSKTYRVDVDTHNPFNTLSQPSSESHCDATISTGVSYLCAVLEEYNTTVDSTTKQLLHEVTREAYRELDLRQDTPTENHPVPTLGDIVSVGESLAKQSQVGQLDDIVDPLARHWRSTHEIYDSTGFTGFQNQTITRFEMPHSDISRYIGLLNEIHQHTESTDNRTLVVIDDAHVLFESDMKHTIGDYFKHILSAGHQTDTSYHLLMQTTKDPVEAFTPSWIRQNIGYSRIYDVRNRQYVNQIGFDPQYSAFVDTNPIADTTSHSLLTLYSRNTISQAPIQCSRSTSETLELFASATAP